MKVTLAAFLLLLVGCQPSVASKKQCMLRDGVTTITQVSSSSNASIGSRLELDVKNRQLTGDISRLVGGQPEETTFDMKLENEDWEAMRAVLATTCAPVVTVDTPSIMGGGTVYWEVVGGADRVVFAHNQSVGIGARWAQISGEQRDALISVWPMQKPLPQD